MDLYKTIKHMYPEIDDNSFILKDEGEGAFIAEWNAPIGQPSTESLIDHWNNFKDEIEKLFNEPSQLDILEQTQADLIFTLMMNGVI